MRLGTVVDQSKRLFTLLHQFSEPKPHHIKAATVIGVVSRLIGVGGGEILILALVYFYGTTQIKAQGTSLATLLLPIGIFAFWTYYKAGLVNFKLAMLISVGFAAGGWYIKAGR